MKRFLQLFCAGVLISVLGAACSDGGKPEGTRMPGATVQPVPANNELRAFFDENLWYIGSSIFGDYDEFGLYVTPVWTDCCVLLNSADEFWQQVEIRDGACPFPFETPDYLPPVELPAIDFENYTLVIGKSWVPQGGYSIQNHYIDTEDQEKVLNMTVEKVSNNGVAMVMNAYCWGLYPKISEESIAVNVLRYNP